ncbi:MAG: hypothetical protein J5958_06770 [Clostridia bacterium]|nr:hypothetical protein [Clostridia bacterium]MBR5044083.1 hypothetical protein [Clostridia bacterium]
MTAARFLSLVLAFFLGFLSCIGAIFGVGYYAYSRVSLDKLEQWGVVSVNDETYFDEDAEVDLTAMTIKAFVSEIKRLQALSEPVTLNLLQEQWGLKLPDNVKNVIPAGVWNVPVAEIFSSNGLKAILENTDVSYLFQFLDVSDSLRESLEGKSLGELTDYRSLLENVRLGDLMGYQSEKDDDGNTVWKDSGGNNLDKVTEAIAKMTLSEITDGNFGVDRLLTGLYVGDLLKYTTVQDDDGNTVWKDANGNDLDKVSETLAKQLATELVGGSFSVDNMLNDLYVGDLLKYKPVKNNPLDPAEITGWYKETEGDVDKVTEALAKQKVSDLTSGTFEVGNVLTGLYVGDLLKYTPVKDDPLQPEKITGWMDGDKAITGVDRATANIDLGKMINKTDGYKASDAFEDVYVGEAMGYQKGDLIPNTDPNDITVRYKWFKKDSTSGEYTVATTPIEEKLSNYYLGDLMNGRVTSKDLTGGPLHELLNLHAVETPLFYADGVTPVLYTSGEHENEQATVKIWYDENNVRQSDTINALADCTIEGISAQVNAIKVGSVTGHVLFEETWYKAEFKTEDFNLDGDITEDETRYCLSDSTGVLASLSTLTIGDLSNNTLVTERVKTVKVGDAMGYSFFGDVWYTDSTHATKVGPGVMLAIAGFTIGGLETNIGTVKIGEVLGYTFYESEWYTDVEHTHPVDGIMKPFVGMTIDEMKVSENVTNAVKTLKIGDAMGYFFHEGVWYKDSGHTDPVTGMMKALAPKTVGQMDGISAPGENGIPVGELLGYEKHGDYWYSAYDSEHPENNQEVTGVVGAICDSYVDNLSDDIKNMELGKTLSLYKYNNPSDPTDPKNGKWFKDKAYTQEATGVMATFADLKIDELSNEALVSEKSKNVVIGDAMGYTYAGGVWYTDSTLATPVTGVMKALAPKNVGSLNTLTNDMTVGEMMGYEKSAGVWYTDSTLSTPATGVIQAVADSTIANLETDLNNTKVGKILGYTYNTTENWWYDGSTKTSTIINTVSDTELNNIGTRLSNLTVADMFSETERQSGFLSFLPANALLSELGGSGPNSMTSIFQNTHMGDYVDRGLISLTLEKQARLDSMAPGWRNMTINGFLDAITNPIIP